MDGQVYRISHNLSTNLLVLIIMRTLYISALSSRRLVDNIYNKTKENPGFAVQKFSRLLVHGLYANDTDVCTLSNPPIPSNIDKCSWVGYKDEIEDGIRYKYVPFLNIPLVKHICLFLYSFFYVLFWGFQEKKQKVIICDVLTVSLCMGALLASKLNRVQSVAVVTDIYGMMVGNTSFLGNQAAKMNNNYVSRFDKYVLLTEQMNNLVNPRKKPYIVMEGLCDASIGDTSITRSKNYPRTVLYAGGIHEKYGLKMLAEGFVAANVKDAKLVLYGSGPYVEEYMKLCQRYPNLEYGGVVTNEKIVEQEYRATLLVNPRFTTEAFTKYSFPSKNMEYMVSGTPLLTTKLPGMPKEYYPYVFLFEEETVEGYATAISKALSMTDEALKEFGERARWFVLHEKNNIVQGGRVVEMLKYTAESKRA